MLRVDDVISERYQLTKKIGRGGQASVWAAKDRRAHGAEVAVKIFDLGTHLDESHRKKFLNEGRILAAVQHPNVVQLRDHGIWEDLPFHVLEMAPGEPLRAWLKRGEIKTHEDVRAVFRQICLGLSAAHHLSDPDFGPIIHRDLKPENVVVARGASREWMVKVIDFGLARPIEDSRAMTTGTGTVPYMAPEQLSSDQKPMTQTDVFALGVVLCEMLTGKQRFHDDSFWWQACQRKDVGPEKLREHLRGLRTDVPERVWETIVRALSERPEERFVDAGDLLEELEVVAWDPDAIVVRADGTGDAPTLSEAVQKARVGGTIALRPGAHSGGVTLNKVVTIVGLGARDKIIVSAGNAAHTFDFVASAIIRNLTINGEQSPTEESDGLTQIPVVTPLYVHAGLPQIEDCVVNGMFVCLYVIGKDAGPIVRRTRFNGTIEFSDLAHGLLDSCIIYAYVGTGIVSSREEFAVLLSGRADPEFRSCRISGTGGICVSAGSMGSFQDLEIEGGGAGFLVHGADSSPRCANIRVRNARRGIIIDDGGGGTFEGCEIISSKHLGILVQGKGSNPIFRNCHLRNGKGIGVAFFEGASGTFEHGEISAHALVGLIARGAETSPVVRDCILRDGSGTGIVIDEGAAGVFERCDSVGNAEFGMELSGAASAPTVRDSKFRGGKASGVKICNAAGGSFSDCEVMENARSGVLVVDAGTCPSITACRIHHNQHNGIDVLSGATGMFTELEIFENSYCGVQVGGAKTNIMLGSSNIHENNAAGILVYGGAEGSFSDLDVSANGEAGITVRDPGTNPKISNCRAHDGKKGGIHITGGAAPALEDCEAFANSVAGIEVSGAGSEPTLVRCHAHSGKEGGFLVRSRAGGKFTLCSAKGNRLAGMEVRDKGTSPHVEESNFISGGLHGIFVHHGALGTFVDCTAEGNAFAGFCALDRGTHPRVVDGTFRANQQQGILVGCESTGDFETCLVSDNTLAGVEVTDPNTAPTIKACTIRGGERMGFVVRKGAGGTFEGCEIDQHRVLAMLVKDTGTTPTVRGCRIHGGGRGGVVVSDGAAGIFEECEFFENDHTDIAIRDPGTAPTFSQCKVRGPEERLFGYLIIVSGGAQGRFNQCEVTQYPDRALGVSGAGSSLEWTSCVLQGAPSEKGNESLRDGPRAVVVQGGKLLARKSRFANLGISVHVMGDGAALLDSCEIHQCMVGILVDRGATLALVETTMTDIAYLPWRQVEGAHVAVIGGQSPIVVPSPKETAADGDKPESP